MTDRDAAARPAPAVRAPGRAAEATNRGRALLLGLPKRLLPPVIAIVVALVVWEALVLTGWKPAYVLPDPPTVFARLFQMVGDPTFLGGVATTMTRGIVGYLIALVIGTAIGLAVSRFPFVRSAIGSLLTGLQTMPSIAWFPLAILFFGLSEQAILFVVILGAAPSIANGLIGGVDEVPPPLLRTARSLGAHGFDLYRLVIMPAAFPAYLSGLKQGWAFAWRSLLAGELLVIISSATSLGQALSFYRQLSDAPSLFATMIVILVIGMVVDRVFAVITNGVRARRGLGALRS
ncbi:ABC transporter permease [Amnibacterium sp. CER49]|uniref:ABC transporter permease n=1 Tax=Amnibacterium sp. CER49 TaxID=3039161 RepID=UPI002449037E|nr:ABC transporter permease [Amnibacterium sp. CER49]MDH2444522.1 ABC transporter permease [Amnibacterium sp. CER49]